MESILIQRLDGTKYNLDEMDFRVISFDPPSPNYQYTYTQIHELKATRTNTQIQQTTAPLVIQIKAHDVYDYELQRLRLMKIFASYEDFYVYNMRTPFIRWRVRAQAFEVPRLSNFWFSQAITINLDYEDGFAESVSLSSEENFTKSDGKWGFGMNIPRDRDITYHFGSSNTFDVWNLGVIPLYADERPVLYEFKGNVASQLVITNKTTGQTFQLYRALNTGNTFQLYGMKPVIDSQGVYANGNHAYLDLAVGKNEFEIIGATDWTLSVSTRFYY